MRVGQAIRRLASKFKRGIPFDGYETNQLNLPLLERLTDSELTELNQLLPWNSFLVDSKGRRFGNAAWRGKRTEPQLIPDQRIVRMNDYFQLSDKSVLEIGCFEGLHTLGLLQFSKSVIAVDSRIENVVKTMVRCAMVNQHPKVLLCDVENIPVDVRLAGADLVHHVGVMYHLEDPVAHILDLGNYVRFGGMFDTHYAAENDVNGSYNVNGIRYQYKEYKEYGRSDPFSGMYDKSRWLTLQGLGAALKEAGFQRVEVVEERDERNGPRALIFANRL